MNYTLMGLTGQVGGVTARALLKQGHHVRGIVRDKAKAAAWEAAGVELMQADAADSGAMAAAFQGADGVFVMIPPYFAPAPGYPEARAAVSGIRRALEAARPGRVVALSSVGAHRPHGLGLITQPRLIEEELRSVPIPHLFLRAAWFMDNFLWDITPARDKGEIPAFLAPLDRPYPMISTQDIGLLTAELLRQTWNGHRCVELEGPQRYSQNEVAAAFARLLGHPVTARQIPRDQWAALFESQGTPADRIAPRIEMLDGFNSGWIDFEGGGNEHIRGKIPLEESLRSLLARP